MSKPRWQEIQELFERTLELEPDERQQFLDKACGGDSDLRREVEELLDVGEDAEGFLSEPLSPTVLEAEFETDDEPGNDGRFGAYRVIKRLGEGGMSTVYLAVRDDDTFRRRVAIKLIRHGMESRDARRRLLTERQILASLDHPHIAKLFDAGTTAQGLPYFVMEHVEGLSIDAHCERHRLNTHECLELFQKVCAAVHYAHQNLVVHRDIKPNNLMVTTEGEPKLLDFGIAKLLNPELTDPEHEPTAAFQRMLTPGYASPEQLLGEVITTASDVYSLGVLLYRLLTGRLPFRFRKLSHEELIRQLTEGEPPTPSLAVLSPPTNEEASTAVRGQRPSEVARELRGDLDHIVLKALRVSPRQRYASVDQLAADLKRYSEGLPVLAREGNLRYRLGKLARRNWRVLAAAGVAFGLLVAFAIQQLLHKQQLEEALELAESKSLVAEQERGKAEGALAFLVSLFQWVDPQGNGETKLKVVQILEAGEKVIEDQAALQPETEAILRGTLGTIYGRLGRVGRAREHFERALELYEDLPGDHRLAVAQIHSEFGLTLLFVEEYERAQTLMTSALEEAESILGREDLRFLPLLNHYVAYFCWVNSYDQVITLSEEAERLARRPEVSVALRAQAINNRAVVLRNTGDSEKAVELYREGLELQTKVTGEVHVLVATLYNNLGALFVERGELAEAEGAHQRALDLWRKIYDGESFDTVRTTQHLAKIRRQRGNFEDAEVMARQAYESYRQLEGAGPYTTLSLATNLAEIWRELGQFAEAESLLRKEMLEVGAPEEPALGRKKHFLGLAKRALGHTLIEKGDLSEAERYLDESRALAQDIGDVEGRRQALELLITLYEKWDKPRKANAYRQRLEAPAA